MRERLRHREKSFFKDILTCFFAIFQSPFLSEAASFKKKWPLSPADYISFWKRSGNSNLVANPTINPEQKLVCCREMAYTRPVCCSHIKHSVQRAMLGLLLAATSDVLALSRCCYLSWSTRPDSAVDRGAAAHMRSRSEMALLKGSSLFLWMLQLRA